MKIISRILAVIFLGALLMVSACASGPLALEDTTWVLTAYAGAEGTKTVLPDTKVTVSFDSETGEMSGNAGCNHYGGGYEADGSKITVTGPVFSTEMWCGDEKGAQEKDFLEAIQTAETWLINGDKLAIRGGGWTLNFVRE